MVTVIFVFLVRKLVLNILVSRSLTFKRIYLRPSSAQGFSALPVRLRWREQVTS